MEMSKELVEYIAQLSRIKLDGAEAEKIRRELLTVIGYTDKLDELDTDGALPLTHVFTVNNVTRKDETHASYDRAALLENAPERTDETVIVPKTVQ